MTTTIEATTCMTEDCTGIAICRNLCAYHYDRARRDGTRDQYPKMRGEYDTEHPAYATIHMRLRNTKGPATGYTCARCGGPGRDWAFDDDTTKDGTLWCETTGMAYSADLSRYRPLCRPCHFATDGRRKWDPVCGVGGCTEVTKSYGYCSAHEKRYRRYGSPEFRWTRSVTEPERRMTG